MANVKTQPRPTVKAIPNEKKYSHKVKRASTGEPVSVPKEKD